MHLAPPIFTFRDQSPQSAPLTEAEQQSWTGVLKSWLGLESTSQDPLASQTHGHTDDHAEPSSRVQQHQLVVYQRNRDRFIENTVLEIATGFYDSFCTHAHTRHARTYTRTNKHILAHSLNGCLITGVFTLT